MNWDALFIIRRNACLLGASGLTRVKGPGMMKRMGVLFMNT